MAATGIVLELNTAQSSERQGAATNRLLAPASNDIVMVMLHLEGK